MKKTKWLSWTLIIAVLLHVQITTGSAEVAYAAGEPALTTLDISKGPIVIGDGTVTGKTPGNTEALPNPNGYIITGSTTTRDNNVKVTGGVEHNIVLQGASIQRLTSSNASIPTFGLEGAGTKVNLKISGTNQITAYNGSPQAAAINVPEGTELVIDTIDGTNDHKLIASSYSSAAAIGGNQGQTAGKITINAGDIQASFRQTGNTAAAIGGGQGGAGGTIVINGGIVLAESYNGTAAAIGGGDVSSAYPGKSTHITLNEGTITAKVPSNVNSNGYDVIGIGKTSSGNLSANRELTTVIVNGGNVISVISSNGNFQQLLTGRQPVNSDGQTVQSTAIRLSESNINSGSAVTVQYNGKTLETFTYGSYNTVYLYLPEGTHDIVTTPALEPGAAYYGRVTTPASSPLVVSRQINVNPAIALADIGTSNTGFYYNSPVTLEVTNLNSVVNKGNYPLVLDEDYEVIWYKGTSTSSLTVVEGDADNSSRLTVTAGLNDTFRARFVAKDSPSSKLKAGNTSSSYSATLKAEWLKRSITFNNLEESYSFGAEGTIAATLSAGTGTVAYSSSDPTVIAINSSSGKLEALKLGTATITASVTENTSDKHSAASVSHDVTVVPIAPSAPGNVTAVAGDQQAEVSFEPAANIDGSVNDGYKVTAWDGVTEAATVQGPDSPITVTGLTNGTAYTFTVIATNSAGNSAPSDASAAVTPAATDEATLAGKPDRPIGVTAEPGNERVQVNFTAPSANGSAIIGYTVIVWSDGQILKEVKSDTLPINVTDLTNGTPYTFTVVATNAVGDSEESEPTEAVTPLEIPDTPLAVPDAPIGVAAQAQNGQASVSFTPPSGNGSDVLYYKVTAWNGESAVRTVEDTTIPVIVTGLSNETYYTFTVIAVNTVGDSLPSAASEAVIYAAAPGAPSGVSAVAGNRSATVSFTEPRSNGSSAITRYTVTAWSGAEAVKTATGTTSPVTVTGLANGVSYTFTVVAVNVAGDSLPSEPTGVVTPQASSGGSSSQLVQTPSSGSNEEPEKHSVESTIQAGREAEVRLKDEISVHIAAGSASKAFTLKIKRLVDTKASLPVVGRLVSPVYEVSSTLDANLDKSFRLRFSVDETVLADDRVVATVYYFDTKSQEWVKLEGSLEDGYIVVEADAFTKYAVIAITKETKVKQPGEPQNLNDISGHWAEEAIRKATEAQLVNGYPDGSFRPNASITRAQFIVLVARALKLQDNSAGLQFTDQSAIQSWAQDAINEAVSAGLVQGYSDGTFRPDTVITRAEVVTIISRAFPHLLSGENDAASFADDDEIPAWANEAVKAARARGIISGRTGNKFVSDGHATRAESIIILLRALEQQ